MYSFNQFDFFFFLSVENLICHWCELTRSAHARGFGCACEHMSDSSMSCYGDASYEFWMKISTLWSLLVGWESRRFQRLLLKIFLCWTWDFEAVRRISEREETFIPEGDRIIYPSLRYIVLFIFI